MAVKLVKIEHNVAVIESNTGGPGKWGDAYEELMQPSVKEFARSQATAKGIPGASCGVVAGAYPVDSEGNVVAPDGGPDKIAAYRIDIPIHSSIR